MIGSRRIPIGILATSLLLFSATTARSKGDSFRALQSCAEFISNDEIGTLFADMTDTYPEIARALVIGETVEGRPIHALRLSADPEVESVEPEARIIGGIHGNECMGAEVVLTTVTWLVDGYLEADPFAKRLIDGAEITFVPLLNPDGYMAKWATRANADGVDLNRNLHFAWVGSGAFPFSEPETQALKQLSDESAFNLGISYHTVSHYVNGPWNYTPHHPPDAALIQTMGEAYAADSDFDVVFGWDWYDIQGDVNDWSLGTKGTFDWTLELMSDTDEQWGINRAGLEGMLSFLFQGVAGVVTDDETGDPLFARIEVTPTGAPIFTDPDVGDFHRILLPGTYDIRAVSAGYRPQQIAGVVVEADQVTPVDFALERDNQRNRHAMSVAGMTLPGRISREVYSTISYLNDTMVWNALGPPDGVAYSLSANPSSTDVEDATDPGLVAGTITLDMGEDTPVVDREGDDLSVVSATMSDDEAVVLLAADDAGPFVEAARGAGTLSIDIGAVGLDTVRFVKVVDINRGPFDTIDSGYDLDAVVALRAPQVEPDAGVIEPDSGPSIEIEAIAGGCTCRTVASGVFPIRGLLMWLGGEF